MTVETGREAFRRGAWRDAYTWLRDAATGPSFEVDDRERLAVAAQLIGSDDSADLWVRAHHECLRLGDVARAVRCAFWLAFGLLDDGQAALGAGWLARAQKMVDESGLDCVERGYLLLPQAIGCFDDDPAGALERFGAACHIGDRFGDADLAALGRMGRGRALVALGSWGAALVSLDEAMVAVRAGEVSPIVVGLVMCGAIEACQEILELGRAREWTAALSRWCDAQPDLVAFRGQCLVHRAEIMQLHGRWDDALAEATAACGLLSGGPPGAEARYRQGEVLRLRGQLAAAEGAYRGATQAGREPQPGLALLWLAQGQEEAAAAAVRRVLDETSDAAARARVLGPFVEIVLAAGDVAAARAGADELAVRATEIGTGFLRASAAGATGAVLLAEGAPRSALPMLRQAAALWRGLEVRYEVARVGVLVGLACRALGDLDTASMELDAARLGFRSLGAVADAERVDRLLAVPSSRPDGLTGRELEVLMLVAKGRTNRAIAGELVISEHTVARHVQNICAKVGVSSRTAASSFAYEHGLL